MRVWIAAAAWLVATIVMPGCSTKERLVGEQCPSPYAGGVHRDDAGAATLYGTSCAPCGESSVQFDARGCPMFVTFESCGGPICLGNVELRQMQEDAGTEEDAGSPAAEEGGDAG